MKPTTPRTIRARDTDRLLALTADVGDHARVAGLKLAALLEESLAEEAEIEAVSVAYRHGKDSPAAEAGKKQAKAIAEVAGLRAKAFRADAKTSAEKLEKTLKKSPAFDFRLTVAVRGDDSAPTDKLKVTVLRGKEVIGEAVTDLRGRATLRLPPEVPADPAEKTKTKRKADTDLTVVVRGPDGATLAQDKRKLALRSGGRDMWVIAPAKL